MLSSGQMSGFADRSCRDAVRRGPLCSCMQLSASGATPRHETTKHLATPRLALPAPRATPRPAERERERHQTVSLRGRCGVDGHTRYAECPTSQHAQKMMSFVSDLFCYRGRTRCSDPLSKNATLHDGLLALASQRTKARARTHAHVHTHKCVCASLRHRCGANCHSCQHARTPCLHHFSSYFLFPC